MSLIASAQVTVVSSIGGTRIAGDDSPLGRRVVTLRNRGSVSVFVGAQGVTSTTGFELGAGEQLTVSPGDALYALAASPGTCRVDVLTSQTGS